MINGMLLVVAWFSSRQLLFVFFFRHLWRHRGELPLVSLPSAALILVVPPLLTALNTLWFVKIVRGAYKLFVPSKQRDAPAPGSSNDKKAA